jgi:hypothetical protein
VTPRSATRWRRRGLALRYIGPEEAPRGTRRSGMPGEVRRPRAGRRRA